MSAKKLKCLVAVVLGIVSGIASAQSVSPEVKKHMNWCANDWGINEGAQQAVRFANAAAAAGYPNQISFIVSGLNEVHPNLAGNIIKRPPVIDAAKALVHLDQNLAVNLALTCQNHNGGVKAFLQMHRGEVAAWLRGEPVSDLDDMFRS